MRETPFSSSVEQDAQQGFSLAGVLVATAVGSIVMAGFVRLTSMNAKVTGSIAQNGDLNVLKSSLAASLNCEKTLNTVLPATAPCSGSFLTLRRGDGSVLPSSYGSPVAWEVRARCVNNEVIVQAKHASSTGTTGLSSKSLVRNGWFDMFNGTSDFCRPYFTGSAGTCPPPQKIIGMAGPVPVCSTGTGTGATVDLTDCFTVQNHVTFASCGVPTHVMTGATFWNSGGSGEIVRCCRLK